MGKGVLESIGDALKIKTAKKRVWYGIPEKKDGNNL